MRVQCQVSIGELVDKLSILMIKCEKISDDSKRELAKRERDELQITLNKLKLANIEDYVQKLKDVNLMLWDIEDQIRDCERDQIFESKFIELARAVYKTNDRRFEIKNEINHHFGSEFKEVKSYQKY